jgi:signal transduction histidine kinase
MTRRERLKSEIFQKNLNQVHVHTDQLFFWLLLAQWAFAIVLALVVSPYGWEGKIQTIHVHVRIAIFFGGLLNALPLVLIRLRPGWWFTRQTVAAAQMLWSGLLIHLTGGRIETHFHVFGSLAFIAFYRDWRLLPTATVVVAGDHLARGFFWPESVYGIANPEWWRFIEHALWVAFEDVVLFLGCRRQIGEMEIVADREAALEVTKTDIEGQVQRRTEELEWSMRRFRSLVENTNSIPWEYDYDQGRLSYIAPQAVRLLHCEPADFGEPGFLQRFVHADDRAEVDERIRAFRLDPKRAATGDHIDHRIVAGNGTELYVRTILNPIQPGERLRGISLDITQQKKLESELNQAQKLESVGRLAAGVAHEINTPVQFVSDSVHFLRDATQDLFGLVQKLRAVKRSVLDGAPSVEAAQEAEAAEDTADLEYLVENMPQAIDRSLDGLGRVATIVRSMKEFAHPDSKEMTTVDLNRAIDSTLTIARNEYKYVADLETDFATLPPVVCYAGSLNQVVLNIVVNAAHAISDVVRGTEQKGRITVRTSQDADHVVISIGDTGGGIPDAIRERIFDPFFTTKEVGKGTGQGLAIARSVVVDQHHGTLSLESVVGKGTTFFIRLPIDAARPASPAAITEVHA